MNGYRQVLRTALFELALAIRSRRAIVTILLFALIGAGVMYFNIGLFSMFEEQTLSTLGLPAADNAGGVTMTLWRSSGFKTMMAHQLGSSLLFREMLSQHPLALAFGIFVFFIVPVLTLIACAPTAAGEIRSGSVRYVLLRVSRTEWTLGLFFAEAVVLLVAMVLLAVAGSCVALCRLPEGSALEFLPALFAWGFRAWLYSLAWLGLCQGASLCLKSPGKATGFAILLYAVTLAFGYFGDHYSALFAFLRPQEFQYLLWRTAPAAFLEGLVGTLALAFLYLGLGGAVFARRDV